MSNKVLLVVSIVLSLSAFVMVGIILVRLLQTREQPKVVSTNIQAELVSPVASDAAVIKPVPSLLTVEAVSVEKVESFSEAKIQHLYKKFTHHEAPTTLAKQVTLYELTFTVRTPTQAVLPTKAHVYVPQTTAKKLPPFVFGSGTTGLANTCAPTRENPTAANWGEYKMHLVSQAAEGYVVIFPDYQGFHEADQLQKYFIKDSEAAVLLGALQASESIAPSELDTTLDTERIILSGYSQGGHAAFAAAEQNYLLNPSWKILGIVGYAGASNVEALLSDSPRLGPYVTLSFVEHYGEEIEVKNILHSSKLAQLNAQAGKWCIEKVFTQYPNTLAEIYTPEFVAGLNQGKIELVAPSFKARLQENSTFNITDIPILLLQGETDPIVQMKTQRKNRARLCDQGVSVQYQEYPDTNHFHTRSRGFIDTQKWLQGVLAGEPAASNCQQLSLES